MLLPDYPCRPQSGLEGRLCGILDQLFSGRFDQGRAFDLEGRLVRDRRHPQLRQRCVPVFARPLGNQEFFANRILERGRVPGPSAFDQAMFDGADIGFRAARNPDRCDSRCADVGIWLHATTNGKAGPNVRQFLLPSWQGAIRRRCHELRPTVAVVASAEERRSPSGKIDDVGPVRSHVVVRDAVAGIERENLVGYRIARVGAVRFGVV